MLDVMDLTIDSGKNIVLLHLLEYSSKKVFNGSGICDIEYYNRYERSGRV